MGKSFKITTGILLMLFLILSSSCKKYEEGPWFSIYSKAERASGNWRFSLVRIDGIDVTEKYEGQTLNMVKNGGLYWALGYYENSWETYGYRGEWKFVNNKNQIEMHFTTGVEEEFILIWDIIRLAYGDLRLERYEDGQKIEWRMWKPY